MTSTDIAVRDHAPATVRLSTEQLQYIAHTEFVPKSMRGKLPAILACVATGRSLGLSDMSALRSINIIDGKASFSAELMVSLVRERGHSIQGNFAGDACTVTGKRADNGDEMTVTWTVEMAQAAGLLGKDNWKKYTPSMLWARAVSQLCRMLFADCFAGATYTPDEIDAGAETVEWEETAQPALQDSTDERAVSQVEAERMSQATGGSVDQEPGMGARTPAPNDSVGEPSGDKTAVPLDAATPAAEEPSSTEPPSATAAQLKKLNVLVGQLRTAEKITNAQLWRSTHREPVASEDGEVHWSPLRDSLSKDEASALIERLSKYAENLGVAA